MDNNFYNTPLTIQNITINNSNVYNTSNPCLSIYNYHLKELDKFFRIKNDVDLSIVHYLQVMRHLFHFLNENDRKFILFPLCFFVFFFF
jgi:hypothetical protein